MLYHFTARCHSHVVNNKPAPCTSSVASSVAKTEPLTSEQGNKRHNMAVIVLLTTSSEEVGT